MKKIILIIALVVPALIFVFLKFAGKNEFNIPMLYENGIPPLEGCEADTLKPYRIPVSFFTSERLDANVIAFDEAAIDFNQLQSNVGEEFPDGIWFRNARDLARDSAEYQGWKKCTFRVNLPWQTVMFDREGRIRGYYDLRNRDEMDRLRVEMKILLKKY